MNKLENERIAKLETSVNSIDSVVKRLEEKFDDFLDKMGSRYISRSEHTEAMIRLEKRLDEHKLEFLELKDRTSSHLPMAITIIFTLLTSLCVGLITFMLK